MLQAEGCSCFRRRGVHASGGGVLMLHAEGCSCFRRKGAHASGGGVLMLQAHASVSENYSN